LATAQATTPTFLTSSNPDQVKRNVLAGFKDVLLLPVTIVPRTVTFGVNAIVTGGTQAVNGLAMLNPQKWTGSTDTRGQLVKQEDGGVVFEIPSAEDEDEKEKAKEEQKQRPASLSVTSPNLTVPSSISVNSRTPASTRPASPMPDPKSFDRLQLLVSLDTALELIHADRDSLKRCETFAKYPGKYGHKVREAIEEIFILMLKAAGDKHIAPGFRM
jgi:recyclin-1